MKQRIDEALARKLSSGSFQLWDIFFERSTSLSVTFEDGRVDRVISGIDEGMGIRGMRDLKTFYGFTNDMLRAPGVADTIIGAGRSAEKPFTIIDMKPSVLHPVRISPDSIPINEKINLLKKADALARSMGAEVRQVNASYLEKIQEIEIVNDLGARIKDKRVYTTFIIFVIAEKGGRIETAHSVISGHGGFELLGESEVLKKTSEAAALAVKLLSTDKKISGSMPVVISSSAGGTMIHEAVGHSLEADLVQKDMSEYKGKLGMKVASSLVTVVDDATLINKRGSTSFDDEGTPAQKTVLIENGVLKNFLYDRETAFKDRTVSTANGRRESYRFRPIPRMRNTMIAPGSGSAEDLIRDTKKGMYVVHMGGGQVNTVTGEFIFEVKEGYMIEDGRVAYPVRNATLMGKGADVINSIDAVSSDLSFDVGTCGKDGQGVPVADAQPTIRIPSLLVGSK
jgi:TldD protein